MPIHLRFRPRLRAAAIAVAALLLALAAAGWASIEPARDRVWAVDHRVAPLAERDAEDPGRLTIRNVRNFVHLGPDESIPAYETRRYDLSKLESVWLVVTPFSERFRGPAHVFVSFGFADSQFVAISVEARREVGESYSVWAGLLKRYELTYVIGDERDLIGRRALFDGDDVLLYPIRTNPALGRRLFLEMVERATVLAERPEFYNTVTNSCSSNLGAHVNRIARGRIPASWRVVLPGYADEVAHELGLIADSLDVAALRARYRINDRAQAAYEAPDFSLRIRKHPDAD